MSERSVEPDRRFIWLDEDGVRCGPRHKSMKSALAYFKDPDTRFFYDHDLKRVVGEKIDRSDFPSQKNPHELVVGEWIERPLDEDERKKIESVKSLMREGLV